MDKSIHYYGIGFLARAAGFIKQHALTIAYASQYVDNATEGEPVHVGDVFFDPVRTAHYGLKAFNWGVQKKIFIPFHFLPSYPFAPSTKPFSFVTMPDLPFANMVFREACRETEDETYRLIAIGIALHTLADSWAHQGFSGREEPINDVETIQLLENGVWKHLIVENIFLDFMPKIGHAQAGFFPDQSFIRWKYLQASTKKEVERNNLGEYAEAVATIYRLLAAAKKTQSAPVIPWKEIKQPIMILLEDTEPDINRRSEQWRALYKSVFGEARGYGFSELEWRREALGEKDVAWDHLEQSEFKRLAFDMTPKFYKSRWVKFHRAALRQRNFVLEHLQ